MELLTESFPSPETIKDDIIKDGFHIYENAVNVNVIEEIKKCLKFLEGIKNKSEIIIIKVY